MLSNRLMTIYNMMPRANRLIDVGCDHALLDIYAVSEGKVKKALAIDISDKRLQTAKNNIAKYRAKNILLAKNDGLNNLKINNSDVVVISGLGAKTICNIVLKAEPIKHLIIQSNKDMFYLRYKISKMGYHIINEEVVIDKGIYYVVIYFKPKRKYYSLTDLIIGPYIKKKADYYLKHLLVRNKKIAANIPNFYFIRKFQYRLNIILIKKALKKYFPN